MNSFTTGSPHNIPTDLRIPVRVVEYDDISRGQVDAKTTSSRGQHEYKLGAVLCIVSVDGLLPNKI